MPRNLHPNGLGLVAFIAGMSALLSGILSQSAGWIVIAVLLLALWAVMTIPALNSRVVDWLEKMYKYKSPRKRVIESVRRTRRTVRIPPIPPMPKMPKMPRKTAFSSIRNSLMSVVTVNGVRHEVQGSNISVVNDQIYVDGKLVETGELKGIVEIKFEGDLASLKTTHASVACGNVHGNVDAGGSVTCGDVGKSIDAGGSVTCQGVGGSVDAGGSVHCGKVSGNVDAGGSVRMS